VFGSAIVLAGGKSRRMGFDKQGIVYDDKLLVRETIRRLAEDFSDIVVVTHNSDYYLGADVRITKDILPSTGPLAGIHAGLTLTKSEYAFVIACDMPYYNPVYAGLMQEKIRPGDNGILTSLHDGWIEPFHAYYGKKLIAPIEAYLAQGKRNIRDLAYHNGVRFLDEDHVLQIDPQKRLFANLNTREELDAFLARNEPQ
jgi:molybdopterin-guanine dinucleotide biosynthesis protein A